MRVLLLDLSPCSAQPRNVIRSGSLRAERLIQHLKSVIGRQDVEKGDKLPMTLDAAGSGTKHQQSNMLRLLYNLLSRSRI
jgi:hypothetical protein